MHHREQDRPGDRRGAQGGHEVPHRQAGDEHDADAAEQHHGGGAEIRLDQDERPGDQHQHCSGPQPSPSPDVAGR